MRLEYGKKWFLLVVYLPADHFLSTLPPDTTTKFRLSQTLVIGRVPACRDAFHTSIAGGQA
jgi:hypothetical protein